MADTSQGPDWWLASDGKWYPPEQAPVASAPAAQPSGGDAAVVNPSGYPVEVFLVGHPAVSNWRALLQGFMAIPHMLIYYVLSILQEVLWLVAFFTVLFTRRVPDGIRDIQMMIIRYNNRMMSYVLLMHEQYPPFEFPTTAADPGGFPFVTSLEPVERLDRWRCLQPILLIPHGIVLIFVGIGAFAAYVVGWFAVLFTGHQPVGVTNFLVGVGRWITRVTAYGLYLTDQYPPFSLD